MPHTTIAILGVYHWKEEKGTLNRLTNAVELKKQGER